MILSRVRVAIAQCNLIVGDLAGNQTVLLAAAQEAQRRQARILLTPELSLVGYPPEDLLLRPAFHEASDKALQTFMQATADLDLYIVLGHPVRREGLCFNALSVVHRGRIVGVYYKHDLPNYNVFDEQRYFAPDNRPLVLEIDGIRFGFNICEDTWYAYAPGAAHAAGAQVLLVPNASPFHMRKHALRQEIVRARVLETGMPVVYGNLVGGQDELVFDGASFAMNTQGAVVHQMPQFVEGVSHVDVCSHPHGVVDILPGSLTPELPVEERIYRALVLGVRDYVRKNNFPGVIIGLSGGVDSALTLALAVDALGPERVRAVMLPSPYTATMSRQDAREMARLLAVQYDEIDIAPCMHTFAHSLQQVFADTVPDVTEENVQARIRGTLLMALSNKTGRIVLTTGNKSEMATGYCTLYGDMAGGFAVLKDILKTTVYALCRYRNLQSFVIPERIITRAPSAELRADQTDQDSLPTYEVLDGILMRYMENDETVAQLLAAGFAQCDIDRVIHLLKVSEYKRRQAPIGIRVTHRAFGRDWRYPVTSKFGESAG